MKLRTEIDLEEKWRLKHMKQWDSAERGEAENGVKEEMEKKE